MMPKNHDQRILEALDPSAETAHDHRVREALAGGEYLYGLPDPDSDDAVRSWAAKESLKGAAERMARTGKSPMTDTQVEQLVTEAWDLTDPNWSDVERMERVASVINRQAGHFERLG